jgi:hypothetical protein
MSQHGNLVTAPQNTNIPSNSVPHKGVPERQRMFPYKVKATTQALMSAAAGDEAGGGGGGAAVRAAAGGPGH